MGSCAKALGKTFGMLFVHVLGEVEDDEEQEEETITSPEKTPDWSPTIIQVVPKWG
jgi:hypothetical protein